MYLSFVDCSVGKLHGCSSFPLTPAAFAVDASRWRLIYTPRPVAIVSIFLISPRISNFIVSYTVYLQVIESHDTIK
jgi:hypothetical protein